MAAISQTTLSSAFSWKKMSEFRLKFHWSFFPKSPIDNISALFQIMAWRRPGDKPLYKAMMVNSLTHICVARPQWFKGFRLLWFYRICVQFTLKNFQIWRKLRAWPLIVCWGEGYWLCADYGLINYFSWTSIYLFFLFHSMFFSYIYCPNVLVPVGLIVILKINFCFRYIHVLKYWVIYNLNHHQLMHGFSVK